MLRCLLLVLLLVGGPAVSLADVTEREIGDRRFVLFEPAGLQGRAPLVLALHGGFGSADQFRRALDMEDEAARLGFRIAYLEGIGGGLRGRFARTWNAGRCCGPALKKRVDDPGYITDVIDILRSEDRAGRVYMIGHSNGGMMIYRYLCQGPRKIASAVIISGAKMVDDCPGKGAPRALVLHGADDPNVPVAGGKGTGPSNADFTSFAKSVSALSAAGARVDGRLLPGAGHKLRQVDRALPDGLARTAARFMFPGK